MTQKRYDVTCFGMQGQFARSVVFSAGGGMSKKRCTTYGAAVEPLCESARRVHFRTVGMSCSCSICGVYRRPIWKATWQKLMKIYISKCIMKAKKQSRWRLPFDGFPSAQTADWLGEKAKDTSNRKRFAACMKAVYKKHFKHHTSTIIMHHAQHATCP